MSDFAFLEPKEIDATAHRRSHWCGVVREAFANKAKHLQDDAEQATDYCRDLTRAGFDATEELKELEVFANGLLLCVLLLKREK